MTAEQLITLLGQLVDGTVEWMGDIITFVVGQPVILIPMLMFFITGGAIGLVNRLMRG